MYQEKPSPQSQVKVKVTVEVARVYRESLGAFEPPDPHFISLFGLIFYYRPLRAS